MNYGEVIKLLDAGYTKAEIDAMMAAPAAPAEQSTPEEAAVAAEPAAPDLNAKIEALTNDVNKLLNTVKLMNVQTVQMDEPKALPIEETLANIIAPSKKD